jgi:hypothetical protein
MTSPEKVGKNDAQTPSANLPASIEYDVSNMMLTSAGIMVNILSTL